MKKIVRLTEADLARMVKQVLSEQEIGGFKEGPGEKLTPELKHYNTIVKPQLLKAGFKDSYDKVMVPYGTENSMVYGNHNTGVNVVWDRKKGVYSVYAGNNKGLKTFQLGPNDPRLVANKVVQYALSLKGSGTSLNEQDMAPTSSKPIQIFDDQQERSKSIYSLVAGKGTKRVGFDKEKVEFPVKLLGDSQELITSNAVAQIECVGTYKKIYVFRDNKIIANGYNKAATNYFCNAIRKPLPGTVAPNQKPMMQGGLRQIK